MQGVKDDWKGFTCSQEVRDELDSSGAVIRNINGISDLNQFFLWVHAFVFESFLCALCRDVKDTNSSLEMTPGGKIMVNNTFEMHGSELDKIDKTQDGVTGRRRRVLAGTATMAQADADQSRLFDASESMTSDDYNKQMKSAGALHREGTTKLQEMRNEQEWNFSMMFSVLLRRRRTFRPNHTRKPVRRNQRQVRQKLFSLQNNPHTVHKNHKRMQLNRYQVRRNKWIAIFGRQGSWESDQRCVQARLLTVSEFSYSRLCLISKDRSTMLRRLLDILEKSTRVVWLSLHRSSMLLHLFQATLKMSVFAEVSRFPFFTPICVVSTQQIDGWRIKSPN